MLYEPIILEEEKRATFQLGVDKAPRLNGFSARFFQAFWDIIGTDVHLVVEESRKKTTVLGAFNHTFIALIPKKKDPQSFGDYRPMSLCNTIYKIISKIIAKRLKKVLKNIISEEQSGFSLGISIFEGIIVAHETIHLARKARASSMIIKLEILKAYDLVDRQFLLDVLKKFGFK